VLRCCFTISSLSILIVLLIRFSGPWIILTPSSSSNGYLKRDDASEAFEEDDDEVPTLPLEGDDEIASMISTFVPTLPPGQPILPPVIAPNAATLMQSNVNVPVQLQTVARPVRSRFING